MDNERIAKELIVISRDLLAIDTSPWFGNLAGGFYYEIENFMERIELTAAKSRAYFRDVYDSKVEEDAVEAVPEMIATLDAMEKLMNKVRWNLVHLQGQAEREKKRQGID